MEGGVGCVDGLAWRGCCTCGNVTTNWPFSWTARQTGTPACSSIEGGTIAAFLMKSCGSFNTVSGKASEKTVSKAAAYCEETPYQVLLAPSWRYEVEYI